MTDILQHIPLNEKESSRLYFELSHHGAPAEGRNTPASLFKKLSPESFWTLSILQSRYDPRLLAILIAYFSKTDPQVDPIVWKKELVRCQALPILGVISEFVLETRKSDLLEYALTGAQPLPSQLFYKSLYKVAGSKMNEVISKPLWAFKKWGFLAADRPALKEDASPARRIYHYDTDVRLNILRDLASHQKHFRQGDYLKAIHFSVSRQQALKDLSVPWIRKKGKNRGCYYSLKGSFKP